MQDTQLIIVNINPVDLATNQFLQTLKSSLFSDESMTASESRLLQPIKIEQNHHLRGTEIHRTTLYNVHTHSPVQRHEISASTVMRQM